MTATNYNQAVQYKYRLNSNWKDSDSLKLEGVELTREWIFFSKKKDSISHHVKTKLNPNGIVDYEEVNPYTQGVYRSSVSEFDKKLPIYTKDMLDVMKRDDLVEISRVYSIDPVRKTNDFLIKLIIDAQKQLQEINDEKLTNTTTE